MHWTVKYFFFSFKTDSVIVCKSSSLNLSKNSTIRFGFQITKNTCTQLINKRKTYILGYNLYNFNDNHFKFQELKTDMSPTRRLNSITFETHKHYVYLCQSRVPRNKMPQKYVVMKTFFSPL